MTTLVTYDSRDSIATIAMDDGKMNVLSLDMLSEIGRALDQAQKDGVGVILTGREGVFSAGFDLKVLSAGGPAAHQMLLGGFDLAERILSFPAPVVIACSGHAIAMGAFLLLSGDFRFGAAGAFKIGANEVAIGLTMPYFAIEICRQRLLPAHFHRAVINAEFFPPNEAAAAGFLDQVVPASELEAGARGVALKLAKLDVAIHTATKLRARAPALTAIRAAIEADGAVFRERLR